MAIVRPFRAVRPAADKANDVAALPYDVMNSEEAREMVVGKPFSFLHIDKAEIDLPKDIDVHSTQVYEKARDTLNQMIADGIFIQDETPCFYLYRLTMDGRSQTGLVTTTSIDEYMDGTIKKHEFTRADKELDRINHVDYCDANTGPIFLAYRQAQAVQTITDGWKENNAPIYDFIAEDGVGHTIWQIADNDTIDSLVNAFKAVPALYIADGHHRTASAVKVGLKRREANPNYDGTEEFNYFLSVIFPDAELAILDYNRVVKDLNGLTKEAFLEAIAAFNPQPVADKDAAKPKETHTFGMYLDGQWYTLAFNASVLDEDSIARLDVSILQKQLLEPILAIGDPRTDSRIDFVGGIRGLGELERRVDNGEMALAFAMFPTSVAELMQIADENKVMPPKSTWFEPKLRSGLFVHPLK